MANQPDSLPGSDPFASDPTGAGWRPRSDEQPARVAQPPPEPERVRPAPHLQVNEHCLHGQVRNFRERRDTEATTYPLVWTFLLERYEGSVRLPPIPVQMRGASFTGFINDGDTVALYDPWQEGTVVQATRVYNVHSGTEVRALDVFETAGQSWTTLVKSRSPLAFFYLLVIGIVFLGFLYVSFRVVTSHYEFGQHQKQIDKIQEEFCKRTPRPPTC